MSSTAQVVLTALEARIAARGPLPEAHDGALRLFNGFTEGPPALCLDLYGRTLVVHDHADGGDSAAANEALAAVRERLPWIRAALWKVRGRSARAEPGHPLGGTLLLGSHEDLDTRVREDGVTYALALDLNKDASFYLDTRPLRAWAKAHLAGKRVLNAFAHTGSIGVAARAAPAARVFHVDKSRAFLDVAKRSYALNGFPVRRGDFRAADFFAVSSDLRRQGTLFDCVVLDPPFFADGERGRVDLEKEPRRLIDKARPLVGDGGWLVSVNNALFLSGEAYLRVLDGVCAGGYATLETLVPVPDDFVGYPATRRAQPPVDPAPFNHPTKIAILRLTRKDGRKAG